MYVCICRAVTEQEIRAALEDGACTMRELRQRLGVCSDCGKCGQHARKMLVEHREVQAVPMDLSAQRPIKRRPREQPVSLKFDANSPCEPNFASI